MEKELGIYTGGKERGIEGAQGSAECHIGSDGLCAGIPASDESEGAVHRS